MVPMDSEDQKLHDLLKKMTEVPFTPTLQDKILEQAQQMPTPVRKDRLHTWRRIRFWGVASGVLASVAILIGVWQSKWPEFANLSRNQSSLRGQTTGTSITQDHQRGQIGLIPAPIRVNRIWLGTQQGFPPHSVVFASLTNLSNQRFTKHDVVGVLAFSPNQNILQEDWLAFVNGPSQVFLAKSTVVWSFHPVGAPSSSLGALLQQPYLYFYMAKAVSSANTDTHWNISPLRVSNLQVLPGVTTKKGQSVHLSMTLTNPTNQPISLNSVLAAIWFNRDPQSSFMSNPAIRFLSHIQQISGATNGKIAPHQSVEVDFEQIAAANADFFSLLPHVLFLQKPILSGS